MTNVILLRESDKTTIGVILDRELRKRLEAAAAQDERSVGAEVRVALRGYLERTEKEEQT